MKTEVKRVNFLEKQILELLKEGGVFEELQSLKMQGLLNDKPSLTTLNNLGVVRVWKETDPYLLSLKHLSEDGFIPDLGSVTNILDAKKSILIFGSVGSGKTWFLKSLMLALSGKHPDFCTSRVSNLKILNMSGINEFSPEFLTNYISNATLLKYDIPKLLDSAISDYSDSVVIMDDVTTQEEYLVLATLLSRRVRVIATMHSNFDDLDSFYRSISSKFEWVSDILLNLLTQSDFSPVFLANPSDKNSMRKISSIFESNK